MPLSLRRFLPARLFGLFDSLRSTFWFTPLLMMATAVVLAAISISVDAWAGRQDITLIPFFERTGPEGARAVLSSIAGSMITVTALVFSITIVALTLASSQFGPRLLRNFMRDTGNQVVLGTFVSTFLYCLLVLLTVRGTEDYHRVPLLGMTIAVALTVVSLLVLVYFIHHVAVSMQPSTVITAVGHELERGIEEHFPEAVGTTAGADDGLRARAELEALRSRDAATVAANRSGYVRLIDGDRLLDLASDGGLVIELRVLPGDFVIEGQELLRAWPRSTAADKERSDSLRSAIGIGSRRTTVQDVRYPLNQLVEIALRSLSSGINDPFTAISCVHRLGQGLGRLAARPQPPPWRLDDDGSLRVWAPGATFVGMAGAAVDPLRRYGAQHPLVVVELIAVLEYVHAATEDDERRRVLQELIRSVRAAGVEAAREDRDRGRIEAAGLEVGAGGLPGT